MCPHKEVRPGFRGQADRWGGEQGRVGRLGWKGQGELGVLMAGVFWGLGGGLRFGLLERPEPRLPGQLVGRVRGWGHGGPRCSGNRERYLRVMESSGWESDTVFCVLSSLLCLLRCH